MEILIETPRLIIRELQPTDVNGMFDLDSDPEVHQYLGNQPVQTKDEIVGVIDFIRQQYKDNGIGRWAMVDKETNEFIGWTGFKYVTEAVNKQSNYIDLGYRLRKKYWRKGLATEAGMACLSYGFNQLGYREVFAVAACGNDGSNRVLCKLGFMCLETFDWDGEPHFWYRLDKETFEARKAQ